LKVPPGTSNQPTCGGLPTSTTGKRQFPSTLTAGDGVGEVEWIVDWDAAGVTGRWPEEAGWPHDAIKSTAAKISFTPTISTQATGSLLRQTRTMVGRRGLEPRTSAVVRPERRGVESTTPNDVAGRYQ
jgi:hypothetical protein